MLQFLYFFSLRFNATEIQYVNATLSLTKEYFLSKHVSIKIKMVTLVL